MSRGFSERGGRAGEWGAILAMLLAGFAAGSDRLQAQGAATDAGAGADAALPGADPRSEQIRALLRGTLDLAVDPQSLFDVSLSDDNAVSLERVRILTLLHALDAERAKSSQVTPPARRARKSAPLAHESPPTRAEVEGLDPALWQARIELDRIRLEVYSLPADQRSALVAAQAARVEAASSKESDHARQVREAEQERQRVLESVHRARSEAERLVAEELARLLGIERALATLREEQRRSRAALAARRDNVLGWQRRARDIKAGSVQGAIDADATYAGLRRSLRASRDELAHALTELNATDSEVPSLGPNALDEVPPDVPTAHVRERRAAIARGIETAREDERALREERAAALLDEVRALNQERLGLLAHLSPTLRKATTGFGAAGLDQARSEARHLVLILLYHQHVVTGWLGALRSKHIAQLGLWRVLWAAVPWLLVAAAYSWWRRHSPELFMLAEQRVVEIDRSQRRTQPSATWHALHFVSAVRRPLERLLVFWILIWLLPGSARALLEVQLLAVIVGWTLGGSLVVNAVNALATSSAAPDDANNEAARLRLRSLRLVGLVVVVLGLILVLSARLVGEGTIYSWTLSLCWLAAVPVFLVLVRWWRETVFTRIDRVRRKTALQTWLLANRSGWQSFFAAMIAAVHLFCLGAYKVLTRWLAGFYLTRRAHAYLFKRELDRLAVAKQASVLSALHDTALASLAPDRASDTWVACPADEQLQRLMARLAERRRGVLAVVGGLGSGKSSLLRRVAADQPGALSLRCTDGCTLAQLLAKRTGDTESPALPALVLLDDAQALVKPLQGGLKAFDHSLAYAREHGASTLWVFAIDDVIWPFLSRARDSRPLFDEILRLEPWTDEQVGQLLSLRSEQAGIVPIFEDLLEKLPPNADEVDKQEALDAKRAGYFRMVWDYARGNPAVALEVWRNSLAADGSGGGRVRPLQAPGSDRLEALPESALFILRAVLQLAPASLHDIGQATRLSEAQVWNAIRYGEAHGYLVSSAEGVRVQWAWLRSVLVLLERRHLLVRT